MEARLTAPEKPPATAASARTLGLFVLTACAAPLLLFSALGWFDWQRLEQEARLRGSRTATALAEQALRVFDANASALARIEERARGLDAGSLGRSPEFSAFLRGITAEVRQAKNVGIIAPDGRLSALSAMSPAAGTSLADRDFFQAHVGSNIGVFVGNVMRVGREDEPKFMISRSRRGADGNFGGVIFSTVSPTALTDFYRSITDPGDSVTLARSDGAVLARYPAAAGGLRRLERSAGLMQASRTAPGGGSYRTATELDQVERLHAFAPVGGYPVYVSYGVNPAAVTRRWWSNLAGYGLVSAFSSLLLALVGTAALRSANGERRALSQARAAAEAGARAETELSRAREREARDAAEASEERFRRLVEANILPMAFRAFDGRILEANDAFLTMIGYSRRKLDEGRLRWDALTAPEHRPLDEAAARELRETGKAKPFEKEYIARDGRRVPILIAATLLPDIAGAEPLIATYYVDLTEQRRTAATLERERLALAASEARLRAIFESAPVGLAFAEAPSGRIVGRNLAFDRIVGGPELAAAADGAEPEVTAEQVLARALAASDARPVEMLHRRGDGRLAWIAVTAAPIRDGDGKTEGKSAGRIDGKSAGSVLTVIDIDRERRALDATRRLVDELNHRVKNTLSAVQSIAHQTLRVTSDPFAARQAFEARLLALSAAHDVLTRRNWDSVELPELLDAMAAAQDKVAGRWRAQGPRIHLIPRMALPLALAFHELFSNARRHGALSAPNGEVHVSWILRNGADGVSDVDVEWREAGGPHVSLPSRTGFGLRMLKRNLALELDGAVDVDFAETGLVCRIRAPLRAAPASRPDVA
jgi:PAS domain S-box-containing protein